MNYIVATHLHTLKDEEDETGGSVDRPLKKRVRGSLVFSKDVLVSPLMTLPTSWCDGPLEVEQHHISE